ncbi:MULTISPECIES: hypothetical protein [unclassified Arthrobacter]|uniref:hypothetical protein n=1 Tax=unclassified Arthrobacter TaxID=235627 RepID=UPI0014922146|nr:MULTISPECIES: hypothetical protein [unclassified Arthrobacter]MBE0008187.1 hypothetical protein [Arthrobacter sp. AET 35A]NOJ61926.1 hypothetical protein [Arthrobacter sp. 147(2020)]
MSSASPFARLARSLATSAVILSLAAGAHVIGGGHLPAPLIVAVLGSATLLAVTVIARKALTLPALLLVLGVGQWLLHTGFSLTSTASACVAAPARHYAVQSVSCLPSGAHTHAASAHADVWMLALHALAVIVTGFMLQRGETAARLAASWLVPLLRLPDVVGPVPAPRIPLFPPAPIRRSARAFRDVPPLRGPPSTHAPALSPA